MRLFISTTGNDKNTGTMESPLATIQTAAERANPGDIISLREGTYRNAEYGQSWTARKKGAIARITKSGTAINPIRLEAFENEKVVLASDVGGLSFSGVENWIIDGLELAGPSQSLSYAIAMDNWWNDGLSPLSGRGISLANSSNITIVNCIIHDFPGAGVSNNGGCGIYLGSNILYNNAWWSTGGVHGFANSAPAGNQPISVTECLFFANRSLIISHVFSKGQVILDVDEGNNLHFQNDQGLFSGDFLAEDNLLMYGGKAGIGINTFDGARLYTNSFYHNAQNVDCGELTLQSATDTRNGNNLFCPKPNGAKLKLMGISTSFALETDITYGSIYDPEHSDFGCPKEVSDRLLQRCADANIAVEPGPILTPSIEQQRQDILSRWPAEYSGLRLINPETGETHLFAN
jgi:hypothetical protein